MRRTFRQLATAAMLTASVVGCVTERSLFVNEGEVRFLFKHLPLEALRGA